MEYVTKFTIKKACSILNDYSSASAFDSYVYF